MRALLARLTARDWLIVAGGLALVAGIEIAKPIVPDPPAAPASPVAYTQPVMFPAGTRREVRDIARLSPDERAEMDRVMTDARYFAAYAVGAGGAFGWARGFATRDAAQAAALSICRSHGRDCAVIAEALPIGGRDLTQGTLSFDQAEGYRSIAGGGEPRAFARSLDGTWGSATGKTTDDAVATALGQCTDARQTMEHVPPMPCEVIAVWDRGLLPP